MTQHSLTNGLGSIPVRDAQMYKIGCLLSAVGTMAIANDGFVLYVGLSILVKIREIHTR